MSNKTISPTDALKTVVEQSPSAITDTAVKSTTEKTAQPKSTITTPVNTTTTPTTKTAVTNIPSPTSKPVASNSFRSKAAASTGNENVDILNQMIENYIRVKKNKEEKPEQTILLMKNIALFIINHQKDTQVLSVWQKAVAKYRDSYLSETEATKGIIYLDQKIRPKVTMVWYLMWLLTSNTKHTPKNFAVARTLLTPPGEGGSSFVEYVISRLHTAKQYL